MYSLNLICTNRFKSSRPFGWIPRALRWFIYIHMERRISCSFWWMWIRFVDCKISVDDELRCTEWTNRLDAHTRTHSSSSHTVVFTKRLRLLVVVVVSIYCYAFVLSVIKEKWTECVCTTFMNVWFTQASDRQRQWRHEQKSNRKYAFSACSVLLWFSLNPPCRSSASLFGWKFLLFCFKNFYDLCTRV